MTRRFEGRAREWIWAQPHRARVVALTAVVALAAGGMAIAAIGSLGGSDGPAGRQRGAESQGVALDGSAPDPAGSAGASSDAGDSSTAPVATAAPDPSTSDPSNSVPSTSDPSNSAPSNSARSNSAPSNSDTAVPGRPATAPVAGTVPTTTAPVGAGAA
ncbi:MAG TPA: hypothetical protein VGR20_07330, partial [Acidimicrobiia bacterium]|nr:hypothetical protein [Acidimicrobiia bacterium]